MHANPDTQQTKEEHDIEVIINTVDNSLALHYLSIMRDKQSDTKVFNDALNRLSEVLAIEVLHHYQVREKEIETPLEKVTGYELASDNIVLIPIMRAGLGLLEGFRRYADQARVAFIAQKRDEKTHQPAQLYDSIPDLSGHDVVLLDPMLATGGSAIQSIDYVIQHGAKEENIYFVSVISSPEGVARLLTTYPNIKAFTVEIDRELNENSFIVPGLGDAGDRQFGNFNS